MITLDDYFMGRRETHAAELTPEITATAEVLLKHVNDMLEQLGFAKHVKRISGWRPPTINKKTKGAARASSHTKGAGIDLSYIKELYQLLITDGILEEFHLYMEDIRDARDHIHLQITPPKSGKRIFRA